MKHLILLRHAKSEDNSPEGTDYKRRLTHRGIGEVQDTTAQFLQLKLFPTLILCSSATRTKETLDVFLATASGIRPETVLVLDAIYHAPASVLLETILAEGSAHACVMLIGHNPGISDLAQRLSGGVCPGLPTSGMAVITYEKDPFAGSLQHYIVPSSH